MTILLTLTTAGADSGPFDLYSDIDGYTVPFETGVAKILLEAGYPTSLAPEFTTIVRIQSTSAYCINHLDIVLDAFTAWLYNVTFYDCGVCTYTGGGTISNDSSLTVGKWYDYGGAITMYIDSFVEANATLPSSSILDSSQQNTCLDVFCPV